MTVTQASKLAVLPGDIILALGAIALVLFVAGLNTGSELNTARTREQP